MPSIHSFEALAAHLSQRKERSRIAIVCGSDASTAGAAMQAVQGGFAEAIFVGDVEAVRQLPCVAQHHGAYVHFVAATSHEAAAAQAVALARSGEAHTVMKGMLHTATLLRAVLHKECGLLPRGQVLTHVAAAQLPGRPKLLFLSDAAVIPYPTHEQRLAQVAYMAHVVRAFGVNEPRIALLHCAETVSDKFPHTLGYAEICTRAAAGEWGPLRVDGPLDFRTAIDPLGLRLKGIDSCLEGDADGVIVPDIEAGNLLYKALPLLCQAHLAGMLQGTQVPVVLPSRGDSMADKYNSLMMATLVSHA